MRALLAWLLLLSTAVVDAETVLDLAPAWEGKTRPGRAGELSIGIISDTGGSASWTITHGSFRIESSLTQQAGERAHARIVLPTLGNEAVIFDYRGPDAGSTHREFHFDLVAEPLVMDKPPPRAFPEYAAGYDAIDLLVLDMRTLTGLNSAQITALQHYVGSCGRIVFQGDARWRAWPETKACGSANIATVVSDTALPGVIASLLSKPHDPHPSWISLSGLLPGPLTRTAWWLAGFLAFYMLAASVALLSKPVGNRICAALVATSTTSSVLLVLGLWLWGDIRHSVVWEEMQGGANIVSTSRLTLAATPGKSLHALHRDSIAGSSNTVIIHESDDSRFLLSETRPLALSSVSEKRTRQRQPDMQLIYNGALPSVRNISEAPTRAAYLLHESRVLHVPALQPTGRWVLDESGREASTNALTRLLRKRAGRDSALLIDLGDRRTPDTQHWMMIKATTAPDGAS